MIEGMRCSRLLLKYMVIVAALTVGTHAAYDAAAQDGSPRAWEVAGDDLPDLRGSAGSLDEAVRQAIDRLGRLGYLHAEVDSLIDDGRSVILHVLEGPLVRVADVVMTDTSTVGPAFLATALRLGPGDPLRLDLLEEDLRMIVRDLARGGYPLARASLEAITFDDRDETEAIVLIHIEHGATPDLVRIELEGSQRISPQLVGRLTGLQRGRPIVSYDPEIITEQMLQSGFVHNVQVRGVSEEIDGLHLRLIVEDAPPGSFDLALGYLPDNAEGGLVGAGHLQLLNPFGGGRDMSLRLDRMPGQASRFEVRGHDPFLLGTDISLGASFSGVQQDSLYNRQAYRIEPGLRLAPGLQVYGTVAREAVRPGIAGARLVDGRQRIARSTVTLAGAGASFRRVDDRLFPARGVVADIRAERGHSFRESRRIVAGEESLQQRRVLLQRVTGHGAAYYPLSTRQVLRVGVDARALIADEFDRADLFRVGGAMSLRGYDEDRFLTRLVVMSNIEVRHRIDRLSFLYAFTDVAYLERPALADMEGFAGLRAGFGVGMRFDAGFGLLSVSLAMNPQDGPQAPRIHAGVSFGL
jgi:outer membrane protein assembly factor BamA